MPHGAGVGRRRACSALGSARPLEGPLWQCARSARPPGSRWSPSTSRPGSTAPLVPSSGSSAPRRTHRDLLPPQARPPSFTRRGSRCGELILADIGIPRQPGREGTTVGLRANEPRLWSASPAGAHTRQPQVPLRPCAGGRRAAADDRRRSARGHGGPAGRGGPGEHCLPARIASPTYAAQLTTVMTKPVANARSAVEDCSPTAALSRGPDRPRSRGGRGPRASMVQAALAAGRPTVFDADALTSFAA